MLPRLHLCFFAARAGELAAPFVIVPLTVAMPGAGNFAVIVITPFLVFTRNLISPKALVGLPEGGGGFAPAEDFETTVSTSSPHGVEALASSLLPE